MAQDPVVVRFDMTGALPHAVTLGQPAWVTARVFAPTTPRAGRASVLSCLHGGSYDWRYFHIQVPGRTGYSMAEHMAALGHVVIALDMLGVGESARPGAPRATGRKAVAAANAAALRQAYARLREGTLHPGVPPLADFVKVGLGHSMGAMTVVAEQADHATYDLIAPIGFTNLGVRLQVGGQSIVPGARMDEDTPSYKRLDRQRVFRTFHWDDTPEDVLAADAAMSVEYLARMAWEVEHDPLPDDAARVTTPVFLCLGERDVSPDPYREPSMFPVSPDVTLLMLQGAAHCQNFAATRRRLWNRLDRWIAGLADPLD
jgi:alpha-beta hydrolase superfamily lysophospholipase